MMYPGNIILGVNIQFKGFNQSFSIPKLYNTEYSSFTTVPKTEYIFKLFEDYKIFMKNLEVSSKNYNYLYIIIIIN